MRCGSTFSNFPRNGTKGALVPMFLPLNRPCRVHDAARRASVALARGEKALFCLLPGKNVSFGIADCLYRISAGDAGLMSYWPNCQNTDLRSWNSGPKPLSLGTELGPPRTAGRFEARRRPHSQLCLLGLAGRQVAQTQNINFWLFKTFLSGLSPKAAPFACCSGIVWA